MSEVASRVQVAEVLSGNTIKTTAGRTVRIVNTYPFPSEERARQELQNEIGGQTIVLQQEQEDEHGNLVALVGWPKSVITKWAKDSPVIWPDDSLYQEIISHCTHPRSGQGRLNT